MLTSQQTVFRGILFLKTKGLAGELLCLWAQDRHLLCLDVCMPLLLFVLSPLLSKSLEGLWLVLFLLS